MLKKTDIRVDWLYWFKFNISGHMTTVQQLTRLQSALLNLCWEEFGLETKVTTIVTEDMYWVSSLSVIILEKRLFSDSQSKLISRISETAICIVERWKPSMGYCFVPQCHHAQERLHTCHFLLVFFFFCHICRTSVCWDPGILLPWQRDVTTSLSVRKGTCLPIVRLPRSLARNLLALFLAQTVFRNS